MLVTFHRCYIKMTDIFVKHTGLGTDERNQYGKRDNSIMTLGKKMAKDVIQRE